MITCPAIPTQTLLPRSLTLGSQTRVAPDVQVAPKNRQRGVPRLDMMCEIRAIPAFEVIAVRLHTPADDIQPIEALRFAMSSSEAVG